MEALIKSGALDAFGPNRPALLAALPAALGRAEQAARARDSGQVDLFALGDAGADADHEPAVPFCADFGLAERLEAYVQSGW